MIEQLAGIGVACAFGLVCFPGAWALVKLIEYWIDSCPPGPNRKE